MAVAVDATGTKGKSTVLGTTGISYTGITIGASLSNGALLVGLAHDVTISSVAVVWDSGGTNQALTLIGATSGPGGNEDTQWWGLVNPVSGNKTLKVTWNAVTAEMYIGAQSYTGVNQTGGATSFAHFTGTSGTSNAPSRAVTSAVGNIVVANICQDNILNTVSGTLFWTIDNSGPNVGVGMFRSAGAASVTMSGAIGATANWSISGVDIVAAASTAASTGGAAELFAPKLGPDWRPRGFQPRPAYSSGLNAYILGITAGAYTITGNTLTLKAARTLPITAGAYVIAGQALTLVKASKVPITTGTYVISGQALTLLKTSKLPITTGAYVISGQALTLVKASKLPITTGVYTISGNALSFTRSYKNSITTGTYTISGNSLALIRKSALSITTGVYTISGNALNFVRGFGVAIPTASYSILGNALSLTKTSVLPITTGVYTISGKTLALTLGRKVFIATGTYAVAGNTVSFIFNRNIAVSNGIYLITGNSLTLTFSGQVGPTEIHFLPFFIGVGRLTAK